MAFSATDPAGMFLWLKADALALNDGDAVDTWTDSGPLSKNATSTLTARPLYKTNINGSNPALLFDGSNDIMSTAAIDNTNWDGMTLFIVAQPVTLPTGTNAGILVESSANYNTTSNVAAVNVLIDASGYYNIGVQNGSGVSAMELWATPSITAPQCIELNTAPGLVRAQVSGALNGDWHGDFIADIKRAAGSRTLGNHIFNIGCRSGGATGPFSGYIFEIIGYRKRLNYDRRKTVRDYLATKYGITFTTTDAIWMLDGYSHTDGDGTTPANVKLRWWNRSMQGLSSNVEWHLGARLGTTMEKFGSDMNGSDRYLEVTGVATKLLTTDGPSNDLFYRSTSSFNSYAKVLLNLQNELARLAASSATARAITTVTDRGDAKPAAFDASDAADANTYIRNASNRPGVDVIDYEADPEFALAAGVNAADTNWWNADTIHVSEVNGYRKQAVEMWTPWLVTKGLSQWTPADIGSNLVLWLDAINPGTTYADGDPVGQINDLSGNGNHATAAGAARPTYKTNIFGYEGGLTLPGILFAGTQLLSVPSINLSASGISTVFAVVKSDATAAIGYIYEFGPVFASAPADAFALYRDASNRFVAYVKGNVGVNTSTPSTANGSVNTLLTARYNKANAAAQEVETRTQVTASHAPSASRWTSAGSNNNTNSHGTYTSTIGNSSGGGNPFTGHIAALIVIKGADAKTIRMTQAYLRDRYVIS